jgi:hypothetical protein
MDIAKCKDARVATNIEDISGNLALYEASSWCVLYVQLRAIVLTSRRSTRLVCGIEEAAIST